MSARHATYRYVFCGCGPGAAGVLLAAAKANKLEEMREEGVCIVDASPRAGGGRLGEFLVPANTPAGYFIAPINPNRSLNTVQKGDEDLMTPILCEMRGCPGFQELEAMAPTDKAPLCTVGKYCQEITQVMLDVLEREDSSYHAGAEVQQLKLLADGNFLVQFSDLAGGAKQSAIAGSVVLGTGGVPRLPPNSFGREWTTAHDLMRQEGLDGLINRAATIFENGGTALKVMILGGCHSAFSLAWQLQNQLWYPVEVDIVYRSKVRVFFESVEEAEAAGYTDFVLSEVCPVSGQVHRFGGVRPPMRELYLDIVAGRLPNVRLVRLEQEDGTPQGRFAQLLKESHVCASAIGYRTNLVPLYGVDGDRIEYALDPADGQALMDDNTSQVLLHLDGKGSDPSPLPNLFGIGLGYGIKPGGAVDIGERGVRVDGQKQYHTWHGKLVCDGLTPHLDRKHQDEHAANKLAVTTCNGEVTQGCGGGLFCLV